MTNQQSASQSLARDLVGRVESLLLEADAETKPLELEPYRSRLFELFVMADGTGFIEEGADPDLTADGIGRQLGTRWGLANAARNSMEQQTKMSAEDLAKMRMMWSFMRMWMEWTYAWSRWDEFHKAVND